MKRMFKRLVLGLALSLISINGAWAGSHASLQVIAGNILVNHGYGFGPATGVVDLDAGDRILAGENASAVLNYAACSIIIKAGSVVTVAKAAPCVAGGPSEFNVIPVSSSGDNDSRHPVLILGEFAGGYVALVGLTQLLASAPASN